MFPFLVPGKAVSCSGSSFCRILNPRAFSRIFQPSLRRLKYSLTKARVLFILLFPKCVRKEGFNQVGGSQTRPLSSGAGAFTKETL